MEMDDEIMNSELEEQIGGKHKYTSNSLLPYRILQVGSTITAIV